ncbi:MAG: MAPEG family protein [Betaproteobacteria bacterium]|jgi:uncharacterized MAPEG superfamily protein
MDWALWCVLIAGLLPYLGTMFAKWGFKRFDNNDPRAWLASQTGFRARGNAAQANSFEAFPLFAAGVIVAMMLHGNPRYIDLIASVFVLARIFFIICYVTNKASLRSLFWMIGISSSVALFIVAAIKI